MTEIVKELPLIRSKIISIHNETSLDSKVGPGSYDIDHKFSYNKGYVPFGTVSKRFPLNYSTLKTPGPGAYNIAPALISHKGDVTTCPFTSTCNRFPFSKSESTPGPGAYQSVDKPITKKYLQGHISMLGRENSANLTGINPTSVSHHSSEYPRRPRLDHRIVDFNRYTGRADPHRFVTPGPGCYDVNGQTRTLYDSKPSCMFLSTAPRSIPPAGEVPGPGAYQTSSSFDSSKTTNNFRRTAPRFPAIALGDTPGPGAYTGNIAPRRPQPFATSRTFPFSSGEKRFIDNTNNSTHSSELCNIESLPQRIQYGTQSPFGSTVPRFHQLPSKSTYDFNNCDTSEVRKPHRFPHQSVQIQNPLDQDAKQAKLDNTPCHQFLNIKYDWSKPSSLKGTFGALPRNEASSKYYKSPDPGSYNLNPCHDVRKSDWSRDIRFKYADADYVPQMRKQYHESTFLKKSHNRTVALHTT